MSLTSQASRSCRCCEGKGTVLVLAKGGKSHGKQVTKSCPVCGGTGRAGLRTK